MLFTQLHRAFIHTNRMQFPFHNFISVLLECLHRNIELEPIPGLRLAAPQRWLLAAVLLPIVIINHHLDRGNLSDHINNGPHE